MLRTTQSLQVGYFTKMPTQPSFSPLRSHHLLHKVSSSGCWCKLMAATLEVIVPPRVVIWWWFICVFRETVKVARINRRGDLDRRWNNKTPLKPADRSKQTLNDFNSLHRSHNFTGVEREIDREARGDDGEDLFEAKGTLHNRFNVVPVWIRISYTRKAERFSLWSVSWFHLGSSRLDMHQI